MTCAECGRQAGGRFCASCGAPLEGARCGGCDAPLAPGARFCTQCGRPVAPQPSRMPWIVAGASLAALIFMLAWPSIEERLIRDAPTAMPPFASLPNPAAGAGSPPPLTGAPREQADRLFNRVMEERSAGNQEQARFFADMAVRAYRMAEPLDNDGLFHLSLLEASSGDGAAAVTSAERILADEPHHLLALAAAGEGAMLAGDTAAARGYFTRFIEHYETERQRQLPEYLDHGRVLPEYRDAARALTGR